MRLASITTNNDSNFSGKSINTASWQARPWAKAIKTAVLSRKMPPWFADPAVGHAAAQVGQGVAPGRLRIDLIDDPSKRAALFQKADKLMAYDLPSMVVIRSPARRPAPASR